ncbi:uncharacterized protein C8Q71DRAFT_854916 [Rhodofomes roseus]|uniref:Uncharacterized protein n=1 Tax=Rhodofomes roseus TaxID=34475 RepID=A0ABQ8KT08_9APHY|nr:uncharacterized protein C8Q71DRAFT_854916 [Rhodofomes roseus]KAH9841059.1 hypothetical protein C8Q71DRAFT_854916 [Rhodofomes roseus]
MMIQSGKREDEGGGGESRRSSTVDAAAVGPPARPSDVYPEEVADAARGAGRHQTVTTTARLSALWLARRPSNYQHLLRSLAPQNHSGPPHFLAAQSHLDIYVRTTNLSINAPGRAQSLSLHHAPPSPACPPLWDYSADGSEPNNPPLSSSKDTVVIDERNAYRQLPANPLTSRHVEQLDSVAPARVPLSTPFASPAYALPPPQSYAPRHPAAKLM